MNDSSVAAIAVRFDNVSVRVPNGKNDTVTLLDQIRAEVPTGRLVTIVGPSGSGKSTLLSLCNLLLTATDGQVYIEEKEVKQWHIPDLRRHVGLVFQTPTMFDGTVLDNLALGVKLRGESLTDPERYLQSVGLSPELLSHVARDLSGGQKQRVALARTLVNRPSILLLDEVTSALDPTAAKEVEELILKLHRELGATILWVTHDLQQARRAGQETWLLVDGRLVEVQGTASFFDNPQEDQTRRFLRGELAGGTPS